MERAKTLFVALAIAFSASPVLAEEAAVAHGHGAEPLALGLIALGLGLMMGLAVLGGTLGQSRAANAVLDGIARNPAASGKFTLPLILSLALIESLVLFAFLISLGISGKLNGAIQAVFGG